MKKEKIILGVLLSVVFIFSGCSHRNSAKLSDKLRLSIENGNYQGVKECLREKDIDLEHTGSGERSNFKKNDQRALTKAIESSSDNRNEIISLLLEAGADVNSKGEFYTYLQYVSEEGDIELAKKLVGYGADVNGKAEGYRVLDGQVQSFGYESGESQVKQMKYLISKGAKVDQKTLKYAMEGKWKYDTSKAILSILNKKGKKVSIGEGLQAAINGDDQKLQQQIRNNTVSKSEKAEIIFFAAANCKVDTLQLLVKHGYNLKKVCFDSMTPLHVAARYNDARVVKYLIQQKVNGNPRYGSGTDDMENYSALDYAAIAGNYDSYKACQKAGIKDADDSLLWEAVTVYGNEKSMKILDQISYIPSSYDIMKGYENGNDNMIDAMMKRNEIPPTITEDIAIASSQKTIEKLYAKGVNISEDALIAVMNKRANKFVVQAMKDKRDIGKVDQEKLLYYAIESGNLEMVTYLVSHGANVNKLISEDSIDQTALHVATENSSVDILKYLLEHGADKKIKNGEGNTAYEIAKATDDKEFMKLLKNDSKSAK